MASVLDGVGKFAPARGRAGDAPRPPGRAVRRPPAPRSPPAVVPPGEVTRARCVAASTPPSAAMRAAPSGGRQHQLARRVRRQSLRHGRLLQGLDQEEEIGRAAAGDRGHRVHQRFLADPHRGADGAQDAFGQRALRRVSPRRWRPGRRCRRRSGPACWASRGPPRPRRRASVRTGRCGRRRRSTPPVAARRRRSRAGRRRRRA